MSDKKLLKENTIRRFMKLANVEALTDEFIQTNESVTPDVVLEEEVPMEDDLAMDEVPAEDDMDMDDDMEMDDDMGDDMDEPAAADISLTEEEAQLLIDLGERLQAAMGEGSEVEGDEDDEDFDLEDDDMEADLDAEDEGPAEEEPEAPGMRSDVYENKEAIIEEVLKRVTQRIVSKKMNRN